ncbi:diguanylate cyclase (GGDEF) domain-containing protein [Franzmannia pantelleriensis]|uniref:Diguanylate cyclase (GGDEF) domain-containing protein n=1 Tax=Franzmannia pantelleriensis TaxID=48727 RepID=A0A1G9PDF6_9GAMM|nr:7TM diverse intracellular signaling domain-containing protein [Halomonas pantelleriensis]SDL96583.1 diguanylate cyclase (GGDEF) domain-containing protein [Halomonas pantelleriensis]
MPAERYRLTPRLFVGVLLSLCWLSQAALADHPTLALSSEQERYSLDPYTAYVADPHRTLTLEALLSDPIVFTPAQQRSDLHLGYTPAPMWLRAELRNASDLPQQWIVQFEYPFLDYVRLHVVRDQDTQVLESGSAVPVSQRALPHRQAVFPLPLAPGETVILLTRIEAHGSKMLSANVLQPERFYASNDRQNFWLATYFGMLLALGVYNLLLFFGLRERVFLHYALFVFGFTLAILTFNGTGTLIFWSGLGEHSGRLVTLGFTLASAMATLFAQSFLDTATYSPRWHRMLGLFRLWCWLAVAMALILPMQAALQVMDVTGFSAALLLLACAVSSSLRHVPGARLFTLAWSILLLGASVFALRNLGILPSNFITLHGIQIGSALEMLLLSFALAARFNKLKRQKEQAQAEMLTSLKRHEAALEQKVAERTAKLEAMASSDMLTGLLNRIGLARSASSALQRSRRTQQPAALLMLDLDDFKPINDRFGHAAGDLVLQQVARRITEQARAGDHCARFGGDEFIVLVENCGTEQDVAEIRQRLLETITAPIDLPSGHRVSVGVSIGSSRYTGGPPDFEELLRQADSAMYRTKGQTGERFRE